MDTTHTSFAARDGRRLTLETQGSGRPLLCHPGGPGFSGSYFEDLGDVAGERTVVGLNPAGTGGSDPWPEERYSLDRCGARERFFSRKDRAPEFRAPVAAARERMSGVELTRERQTDVLFASFLLYFERLSPQVHAFVERIATGEPPDLSALDSFNAQVDSFDLRPDLPRIDAQALVVYGTGELERAGEDDLVAGLPNARLALIGDAGHFPWVEQPERFREAVLDFLSE